MAAAVIGCGCAHSARHAYHLGPAPPVHVPRADPGAKGTEFVTDNLARSAGCVGGSLLSDVRDPRVHHGRAGRSLRGGGRYALRSVASNFPRGRGGHWMPRSRRAPRSTMERRGAPGGRVDVIHCQELDGGVNDSLGTPRAAATEHRGQSDQIAPSSVTDGQMLPICPRKKDTDDGGADERHPWSRAQAKDEIAGRDVCGLDHTLEANLAGEVPRKRGGDVSSRFDELREVEGRLAPAGNTSDPDWFCVAAFNP